MRPHGERNSGRHNISTAHNPSRYSQQSNSSIHPDLEYQLSPKNLRSVVTHLCRGGRALNGHLNNVSFRKYVPLCRFAQQTEFARARGVIVWPGTMTAAAWFLARSP